MPALSDPTVVQNEDAAAAELDFDEVASGNGNAAGTPIAVEDADGDEALADAHDEEPAAAAQPQATGPRPLSRHHRGLAARPARGRGRPASHGPRERRLLLDLGLDHELLRLLHRGGRVDRHDRRRGPDRGARPLQLGRRSAARARHDPARQRGAGATAGDDPVPHAALDPASDLPLRVQLAPVPHGPVGAGLGGRHRAVRVLRHRLAAPARRQPGAHPHGVEGLRRGGHRDAGERDART